MTSSYVMYMSLCVVCAGKDCDILIHEASMEDELEEEAGFKRHRFAQ